MKGKTMGEIDRKLQVVVADTDPRYRSRLRDRLDAAGCLVNEVSDAVHLLECTKMNRSGVIIMEVSIAQELGYDKDKGYYLIRKLPSGWGVILLLPLKNQGKEQANLLDEVYQLATRSNPQPDKILTKVKWIGKDREELEQEHLGKVTSAVNEVALKLANDAEAKASRTAVGALLITFLIIIGGVLTNTLWLYVIGVLLIIFSMIHFLITSKTGMQQKSLR